jgi:uncharacterized protein
VELIDIKNGAGRSPLGEAEMAGFEEGAKWLVERMKLDEGGGGGGVKEEEGEGEDEEGKEEVEKDDVGTRRGVVEIEIKDAEGGIANMKIGEGVGK